MHRKEGSLMCRAALKYDDDHGPLILFYDLFSAGYVIHSIDYDEEQSKYMVNIIQDSDQHIVTVEDLTQKDVDGISTRTF